MSSSDGSGPAKPFSDWLFFIIAIVIGAVTVPYAYFNYRHTGGAMRELNLIALPIIGLIWFALYRFFYLNYRSIYKSRAIAPTPSIFIFYYLLQILLGLGAGILIIAAILYFMGYIPTGMGPGFFFPSAETDPFRVVR